MQFDSQEQEPERQYDRSDDDDGSLLWNDEGNDDEPECRVCRGPAEEGRPLYKPCKCKGSIGLTHQDCLQSWLEVQRSGVGGTCELCKTKFQFAPLYKENAPERLPFFQFLSGVSEIVLLSWLPSIFRVIFAIVLWIVVTPLLTAYLYQSWMVRPSAALSRFFSTTLIWSDICAGLVLTSIVIVSLLSIMSLADFLRVEWNRPQQVQQQQPIADVPPEQVAPENIDNAIWLHAQKAAGIQRQAQQAQVYHVEDDDTSWDDIDEDYEDLHSVDDSVDEDEQDPPQPPNNDDRQQQQERMDPPDIPPDDFDGVDINIAVDEMLGLRGPILVVVRNVLWVLTFNAIYLGFFAFVPRSVGYTFCSYAFNMTDPRRHNETHYLETLMFENATNSSVWSKIQTESIKHQTIFRLSDVVSITAGYLMIAVVTGFMQLFMSMYSNLRTAWGQDATREDGNNVMEPLNAFNNPRGFDDANDGVGAVAIDYAVKTTFAIVKVGVLLFVKMFLFPIALGLALSWSTMAMIGMSTEDQVGYAGRDIFSFILLHWVAGITFMLLVTVSVLQLREVLHPDVCARVIRPQEPHPDLLGNLMRESIATHIRRMSMSFVVYSFLLFLFISLPTQLHVSFILPEFVLRELKLKFAYYFSSRLQAPLELLTFHFVMLTILEKYKNNIGVVQHRWLGYCSRALGLSKSILPYDVTSFRHLGSRPVFAADGSVDNFWFEVAKDDRRGIRLLEENKSSFSRRSNVFFCVKTKPNGEKVLVSGTDFIRLPKRLAGIPPRHTSIKLKTKLGRYRLKREAGRFQIQLWEEVRGDPIARPPEGWDDLGAGGAHAQGRWAWGKEQKSVIEYGVAERDTLFRADMTQHERTVVYGKLVAIFASSWFIVVSILAASFIVPLLTGRVVFYLLHVPDTWIHDPLGWCIGSIFIWFTGDCALCLVKDVRRCIVNGLNYTIPPMGKLQCILIAGVLHLVVAPIQLGTIYSAVFVESDLWFRGLESFPFPSQLLRSWLLGSFLLGLWVAFSLSRLVKVIIALNPEQVQTMQSQTAWHGEGGRVFRFWCVFIRAVCFSDWEDVDHIVLLNDYAFPVFRNLAMGQLGIVGPPLALMVGGLADYCDVALTTKSTLVAWLILFGCYAWKHEILRFLEVLHRSARDRQYLIGEVLINYTAANAETHTL